MKQTREEVIDLRFRVEALLRKAQCRAVNCEVLDTLNCIAGELEGLDDRMTELIGD